MTLWLGLIPFSVSKAMEKTPIEEKTPIKREQTIKTKDVDFYLKAVESRRKKFKGKYETFLRCSLKKSKEKISDFFIDLLAYAMVMGMNTVGSSAVLGKVDEKEISKLLEKEKKLKPGTVEFKFDENAKKELEKVVKSYHKEIEAQFRNFRDAYKQVNMPRFLKKLNEFIEIFNASSEYDFTKTVFKEAYKDRINEYAEDLEKIFEYFKSAWNDLLKKYSDIKELNYKDLATFAVANDKIMRKIFLDENGNVKVDEFLKEIEIEDRLKLDIDMKEIIDEDHKKILKQAFVKYKNEVNKEIEKFYEQHKEYKETLADLIKEKIPVFNNMADVMRYAFGENNSNEEYDNEEYDNISVVSDESSTSCVTEDFNEANIINENFEENGSDRILGEKIKEYVENLSKEFTKFKNEWEGLLNEHGFEKNLSYEALLKFAAIYRLAMSKIFLDENGNVKVDEFIKKLEKQNGERYGNELTEEQKGILKDAFVKYKRLIEEKLEQFKKEYKDCKKRLNKELDKKVVVFDEIKDMLEYLSKNGFPKENYIHID